MIGIHLNDFSNFILCKKPSMSISAERLLKNYSSPSYNPNNFKVYDPNFKEKVINEYTIIHNEPLYRITTSRGYTISIGEGTWIEGIAINKKERTFYNLEYLYNLYCTNLANKPNEKIYLSIAEMPSIKSSKIPMPIEEETVYSTFKHPGLFLALILSKYSRFNTLDSSYIKLAYETKSETFNKTYSDYLYRIMSHEDILKAKVSIETLRYMGQPLNNVKTETYANKSIDVQANSIINNLEVSEIIEKSESNQIIGFDNTDEDLKIFPKKFSDFLIDTLSYHDKYEMIYYVNQYYHNITKNFGYIENLDLIVARTLGYLSYQTGHDFEMLQNKTDSDKIDLNLNVEKPSVKDYIVQIERTVGDGIIFRPDGYDYICNGFKVSYER